MFIYHFNRMIRSRLLWLFFAVVIAIAFLSVDSCYRNPGARSESERPRDEAGTVGGESVSYMEYEQMRRMFGNSIDDYDSAVMETQIWARIAAMHTAAEMGITVSRQELVNYIVNNPAFTVNGAFDRSRYMAIAAAMRISEEALDDLQSKELVLAKLSRVVNAGATVSPMSIEDDISQYTDIFSVRYATVTNAHANEEVEVTDEDIADYYERNKANYELPARVQIRYAVLPATNFIDAAAIEEASARVKEIYESDPSAYTKQGTNGVEQLTLEEARQQIIDEETLPDAIEEATTYLAEFIDKLGDSDPDVFESRAKSSNMTTRDTSLFAYDAQFIPGIEGAALDEFRSEAFELDATRPDSFYAIARGDRNVYLMRILTNDVAHTQPLDDVAGKIRPLVVSEKRIDLFDADAKKTLESIKAATAGDKDFSDACAELSLAVSTNITFCLYKNDPAINYMEHSREIISTAIGMKAGDISDPVKVYGGGAVIVCLDSRKRNEEADSSFEVTSAREGIAAQRAQATDSLFFSEWLLQNLNEKGFTSRTLEAIEAGATESISD